MIMNKYVETKIDDTEAIITRYHTNKQTNKQTGRQTNKKAKKNHRNRLCNKQTSVCIVLIQGNKNCLMKFVAVSAKMLKSIKCLTKILFNIVDLCLFPSFCSLFKRRLENVTKVFISEVVWQTLKFQSL